MGNKFLAITKKGVLMWAVTLNVGKMRLVVTEKHSPDVGTTTRPASGAQKGSRLPALGGLEPPGSAASILRKVVPLRLPESVN